MSVVNAIFWLTFYEWLVVEILLTMVLLNLKAIICVTLKMNLNLIMYH